MSALDKLFSKPEQTQSSQMTLFAGPMGKLLSSIISPDQMQQMGEGIGGFIQWVKDTLELQTKQNMLIIHQNKQIMKHLGIADDDGRTDSGTGNDTGADI